MITQSSWLTPEGKILPNLSGTHGKDGQRILKEMGITEFDLTRRKIEDIMKHGSVPLDLDLLSGFCQVTGYVRIVLPGDLRHELNIDVYKSITRAQKREIIKLAEGRTWFHWDINISHTHMYGETIQKFNQVIEQNGLILERV